MNKSSMPAAILPLAHIARPAAVIGSPRMDASIDAGKLEKMLAEVNQVVQKVGDDVKRTAEDALKQAKNAGSASEEVKATADKLLTAQARLGEAQAKLEGKLEAIDTRASDIEQALDGRARGGASAPKSLGTTVAGSDEVKAFVQAGGKGTVKVGVSNAVITSAPDSGGAAIYSDRETEIVRIPRRQMTIRQLLSSGTTGSNLVEYPRQVTRNNTAAPVAEGALKPESEYAWERADAPVRTIAHWVPITRQALEDSGQLQAEIDGELRFGLMLAEELQILKGDGTGENLAGLVPEATEFAAAFAVPDETTIDRLRLALLQSSLAEFPADGIVLHPTDWARIELTKDGEQRYIFANVVQMAGPQLWGRPVVATQSMDVNNFLVGAFQMAATLYDRMAAEVALSTEDRDNFVKNMITVRAEERVALAIKRASALVTGTFGGGS